MAGSSVKRSLAAPPQPPLAVPTSARASKMRRSLCRASQFVICTATRKDSLKAFYSKSSTSARDYLPLQCICALTPGATNTTVLCVRQHLRVHYHAHHAIEGGGTELRDNMSSFIPDNSLATSVLSVRNGAAEEKAARLFSDNAVFCDRMRKRDESLFFMPVIASMCHGGKGTSRPCANVKGVLRSQIRQGQKG
jgi:hypothetical protein